MSYRSFKRLLGETSLERKCRLLLGVGIFVLILVSFLTYWHQTEKLLWDHTKRSAELLVNQKLQSRHWRHFEETVASLPSEFRDQFPRLQDIEELLPDDVDAYESRFLRDVDGIEYKPQSEWELEAFEKLMNDPDDPKVPDDPDDPDDPAVTEINQEHQIYRYMGAIKLKESCLKCHPTESLDKQLGFKDGEFKAGDMIAALSIDIPLMHTNTALNVNGAILISFAIGTAMLATLFAYVTFRYVIVKPVAHLKKVSEEIAAGNLDIRSDIRTGDEFQELSHAFNRMLRTLVSMQEELRRVNADLDHKLDELAQANMQLFELNRLKSEFLTTMSHELRTPLNSILGFSDILAEADNLQPKQNRWIQNIQTSGKLLLDLINDILDLAKLEAGKMQVHPDDFSLRDVVEGQLQMTRPMADKKNISLESDIDPAIPVLKQDGVKLAHILTNLISNAIKFTPEGGRIVVRCRADRGHAVISVIDNGVGIAPADQKLVFEKFRQAESGLTRNHGGTGLGLSIVRELTKLLGGDEVSLESELGRGSTFTVRIPMQLDETQQAELTLGAESLEISAARSSEVRYYTSDSVRSTPD